MIFVSAVAHIGDHEQEQRVILHGEGGTLEAEVTFTGMELRGARKMVDTSPTSALCLSTMRVNQLFAPTAFFLVLGVVGCGTQTMAAAPHFTSSVLLKPSNRPQSRTIQFRPDQFMCRAIAQVRPDLKNVRCYDVLTLQLVTSRISGPWTERYASIRQCVARLTPSQLKEGCVRSVDTCTGGKDSRCPPSWYAQTSIEFRTNGHVARKEWITCGIGTFHEFRYRLNWCGAAQGLPPNMLSWLSAGDDYEVRILGTVQVGTEERIMLRPDGWLVFGGCC